MKYITAASLALCVILAATLFIVEAEEAEVKEAPPAEAAKPPKPEMTQAQKESYVIGMFIASDLRKMDLKLDVSFFTRGFFDAYNGNKFQVANNEIRPTLDGVMKRTRERARKEQEKARKEQEKAREEQKAAQAQGPKNLADGKKFLAANAKNEGIKTTASGLQYEILKAAEGDKPKAIDRVSVHYKGTLLNGSVFDSSYKRGKPAEFPLNGVIRGWTEGLQLMSVGSKFKFYIPSHMAYGPQGRPGIPPNSTLIFEVELLAIVK
ncbi:FKBP-type peptidyl-prolyl cis-trans isomerase [Planctomycetota bacterium]